MAQKTFTNEQLATSWKNAAKAEPKGTRRDVVLGIMGEIGVEDTKENYGKMYNNVTQRVKQLASGVTPVVFPELSKGHKGARRSGADVSALQAILNG